MIKLLLDEKAYQEIAESVRYCVTGLFEYDDKTGVVGLGPNGGIHAFTTLAGCAGFRAVPLVFYKKNRGSLVCEFSNIVDADLKDFFLKISDKAYVDFVSNKKRGR